MNPPEKPSPGLKMDHGFLKKIEQNQFLREQQAREDASKCCETARMARRMGCSSKQTKPAMQIYRPPSLRVSGDFSTSGKLDLISPNYETLTYHPNVSFQEGAVSWYPQMNPSPPLPMVHPCFEMACSSKSQQQKSSILSGGQQQQQPSIGLSKSCSTTSAHRVHFQLADSSLALPIHPKQLNQHQNNNNASSIGGGPKELSGYSLNRSKSLGAMDRKLSLEVDISNFSAETQCIIRKAYDDPNALPARQLMEIVRHIFNRVLESVRYAAVMARLCILIIEREITETFLESLLNSCKEWFIERSRHCTESKSSVASRHPMKPIRWVAYVTFLYELYTRLKSPRYASSNTQSPSTIILNLLSECCLLFMRPTSLEGCEEVECLFLVLTVVGRDLKTEHPQRMQVLMNAARDAFVAPTTSKTARKTLLQLIEMNASNWQLTASAVAYYYPGHSRE